MDHQNGAVHKTAYWACVKLHAKNTAKNHVNNTMQHRYTTTVCVEDRSPKGVTHQQNAPGLVNSPG